MAEDKPKEEPKAAEAKAAEEKRKEAEAKAKAGEAKAAEAEKKDEKAAKAGEEKKKEEPKAAEAKTAKDAEAKPAAKAEEKKKEAKPRKKAGLYYPNNMGRIILKALEEVMGKNGLNAILNLAGLSEYIDNYPPENMKREFDFADITALCEAVEDMYGPRGGRGLLLRAGRATFAQGLKDFGAIAGAGDLAFKVLPLQAKLRIGVPAIAKVFSGVSDQKSVVEEKEDHFRYIIHQCSMCWERKADKEICYIATGILQEALRWVSTGHEFRISEVECRAKGDENCVYIIQKEPIG